MSKGLFYTESYDDVDDNEWWIHWLLTSFIFSADSAPDSNTPGNSGENTFDDDLADYPHVIDDQIPGINEGDNDDDNDDGDIGDEGFYDDDDDGSESLRQGLVRGSNSSVVHKKDEVRSSGVNNTSPQQQQSADHSEINESGLSDDIDDKSGGSGSGSVEGKGEGVFAR